MLLKNTPKSLRQHAIVFTIQKFSLFIILLNIEVSWEMQSTNDSIEVKWDGECGGLGDGKCFWKGRKTYWKRLNLENLHSSGRTINHCQHGHCSPFGSKHVCVCADLTNHLPGATFTYARAMYSISQSTKFCLWFDAVNKMNQLSQSPFKLLQHVHVYSIFKLDYSMHARLFFMPSICTQETLILHNIYWFSTEQAVCVCVCVSTRGELTQPILGEITMFHFDFWLRKTHQPAHTWLLLIN